METLTFIEVLLLGGLLGLIGQSIRVIVGLKKTYDTSAQQNVQFKEAFDTKQLVVSLLIGFVAGCLAILLKINFTSGSGLQWTKDLAVEVIAVGYAGADFIEGFIKKYLPSSDNGGTTPPANPTGTTGLSTENIVG